MFEFIRSLLCPFEQIEKYVPERGNILDVGSGHGTFSFLLSKNSKRKVLGIDPSPKKILSAKKKIFPNLKFKKKYIHDLNGKKFDCITIIDVLYLLPENEKSSLLKKAKNLLKKGGYLILVINGRKDLISYKLLNLEETIMVKILKKTYSDNKKLYFRDNLFYKKLLKKLVFRILLQKELTSKLGYPPHILFLAKVT